MKTYLVRMFGISLALTIFAELIVAFLIRWFMKHMGKGRRNAKDTSVGSGSPQQGGIVLGSKRHLALLVVLVNLLTNPLAVLLCWLGRIYLPPFLSFPLQLTVEMAVVAAEAWIYRCFTEKPGWQTGRPVLLAVMANICSCSLGVVCARRIDFALSFILRIRQTW
ncbi:MAG: hypothetical protein HFH95_13820 [Lachnospiraceae bacterium]|nr:hypothetical protein [uncultured Acetatifactor sp.]MCI8544363.1 hypothetical protein [Lachnospiraceae bacterium]